MGALSTICNPFFSGLPLSSPSSSCNLKLDHISLPSVVNLQDISWPRVPLCTSTHCFSQKLKKPRTLCSAVQGFEEKICIEKTPAFPTVFDIKDIQKILPHRYPFLLVDRVIEYNPGVSVVGIKHLTSNDSFFLGHFPGNPVMPGVLITEAMAQVSCLLVMQPEVGFLHGEFLFFGIDKVKFRKVVTVGDTLVMRLTLMKVQKGFGIAKLYGKAYVGGELVCEGQVSLKGKLGNYNRVIWDSECGK